jgi:phosphate-selective porin OprO and OprP
MFSLNLLLILMSSALAQDSDNPMANRAVPAENVIYKPGTGLEIKSEDGDFKMVTRLRAQQRYTLTQAQGEISHGFQLRRARLMFKGNVFGEDNTYKFELAVSPKDIGLKPVGTISKSPLQDWYFHFAQFRDVNLRMGQYKVPYSRQRVVSSGNLQMVDRSIVNGEFNLDRDVGLDIRSKDLFGLDMFRYYAGVYMGEGHSSYAEGDLGMMYLARIEFLPLGLYKDYVEGDLARTNTPRVSLGAGFAYVDEAKKNQGIVGTTPLDGGTTDTVNFNADVGFKYSGLSFESAFFWREGTRNPGSAIDESGVHIPIEAARNGMGFYSQGGYLLPKSNIELSARYGQITPNDKTSLEIKNEAGLGLSNYIGEHSFKLQGDFFRLWSEEGFSSGENQFRLQLQMAY